jgi:hypothetical protein
MKRIAVTLLCVLALSACTADPGTEGIASVATAAPTVSASPGGASREAAMRQFEACMTSHGVTITNPGRIDPPSTGPDSAAGQAWNAAMNACKGLLPAADLNPAPDQAELEKLRVFAVCMRAHDIPMTDPLPDGNMKINGRFEHVTRTQLEADPVYIAAMTACRDKLPEAGNGKSGEPTR